MSRLFLIKAILTSFLALILLPNTAMAKDSIRVGDKAIMFQLSKDNLFPEGLLGGVGYQFYVGSDALIRIPIGLGYSNKLEEKPQNAEVDKESESWSIRLTPGIRYNFGGGDNILVYTGGQLLFNYATSTITGKDFRANEENTYLYSWGIGAMLGAEWFPLKSLSLGLEYSPFLSFTNGQTEYKSGGFSQTNKSPSETNFDTNFSSILLTISFWFN